MIHLSIPYQPINLLLSFNSLIMGKSMHVLERATYDAGFRSWNLRPSLISRPTGTLNKCCLIQCDAIRSEQFENGNFS